MNVAALPGTHTFPDTSTVDVTVRGRTAELRGTSPEGEATYTVVLPTSEAAALLSGVAR